MSRAVFGWLLFAVLVVLWFWWMQELIMMRIDEIIEVSFKAEEIDP